MILKVASSNHQLLKQIYLSTFNHSSRLNWLFSHPSVISSGLVDHTNNAGLKLDCLFFNFEGRSRFVPGLYSSTCSNNKNLHLPIGTTSSNCDNWLLGRNHREDKIDQHYNTILCSRVEASPDISLVSNMTSLCEMLVILEICFDDVTCKMNAMRSTVYLGHIISAHWWRKLCFSALHSKDWSYSDVFSKTFRSAGVNFQQIDKICRSAM